MRNFIWIIIALFFPCLSLSAQDAFGDIFGESEIDEYASGSNIEVTGKLTTDMVYFFNASTVADNEVLAMPNAELNINILEKDVEGIISLNISPQKWDSNILYTDIVNELYLRSFFSFGYLEAGLMKVEWGSADGIHVLDPLSHWDLSDGYSNDISNLKKAGVIVKMNFYVKDSGLLEIAYKPFFSSNTMAQSGRWATGMGTISRPDTTTLEYSQAALRLSGTLGRFDIGTQYYYGYLPDPAIKSYDEDSNTTSLGYDRAHLFGLEGGFALGFFTFWMEIGYWLTEDMDGDDPTVYNNRIVYLPGMDFTIPGMNLYLNFQLIGDYTFNTDNLHPSDIDETTGYGTPSHNNMLLIAAEFPFNKDKNKIRLSGMWSIEEEGYMILPEFLWDINDNLYLSIYGQIIEGKDGNAGMMTSWKDNDNFAVKISYVF